MSPRSLPRPSRALAGFLLLFLANCAAGGHYASAAKGAPPPPPPPPSMPGQAAGEAPPEAPSGGSWKDEGDRKLAQNDAPTPTSKADAGGQVLEKRAPILIYTANLTMAVFEVDSSLRQVEAATIALGGFLSKRTDKAITVRVPASRFQEAVARIERLGDVTSRDVVALDVTEEFLDVEIRLRNARAVRDRLAALLAQAKTVQDSLLIEKELTRVASEIERMEGKLKYLRDRAAFSTITVSFDARRTSDPATPAVRLPFPFLYTLGLGRLLDL